MSSYCSKRRTRDLSSPLWWVTAAFSVCKHSGSTSFWPQEVSPLVSDSAVSTIVVIVLCLNLWIMRLMVWSQVSKLLLQREPKWVWVLPHLNLHFFFFFFSFPWGWNDDCCFCCLIWFLGQQAVGDLSAEADRAGGGARGESHVPHMRLLQRTRDVRDPHHLQGGAKHLDDPHQTGRGEVCRHTKLGQSSLTVPSPQTVDKYIL